MGYAVGLMEYSDDPLSDVTPTYVDRSSYVVGDVTWSDGKARDLDEPQAGSISFRLSNANGEWVPNSAGSLYPDSPFLLRRFRWSVNGTAEGVWYAVSWRLTNPAGTAYSEVEVTCVDGFELLSLDNLDLLDPPTASSYEDVVLAARPSVYYRCGDTGQSLGATLGPEGSWVNSVTVGVAGQLLADPDTAVRVNANNAHGIATLETSGQFVTANALSLELWFKDVTVDAAALSIMSGAIHAGSGAHIFELYHEAGLYTFGLVLAGAFTTLAGSAGASTSVAHHVVATWDGSMMKLYRNGILIGQRSATGSISTPTGTPTVKIGAGTTGNSKIGIYDEVAFYEYPLSAEVVSQHYAAGATAGLAEQAAGDRVAAVADSDLWNEAEIQTGEHMVHAVMQHGQSKLDELRAAVKAEMPESHFFFEGDGDPIYLGWGYKATAPFNEPQGTFGAGPGEIGYSGIEIVYDDEMFNDVTVGHEAQPGEETQHTATDDDSIDEFRRRVHAETGLILSEHQDAIAVADRILELHSRPQTRVASLTVNGAQTDARAQILARQIGDLIRVKSVDQEVDVVTTILGKSKTLTAAGHLTCTWTTARGFDASGGYWHLGIVGFWELGTTTVLA